MLLLQKLLISYSYIVCKGTTKIAYVQENSNKVEISTKIVCVFAIFVVILHGF